MVQASRMDSLRQRLENQGLRDVVYMVVSHQGAHAQGLHAMLAQRLTEHISLYKQDEALPDVWQTLGGNNNDFFIYDRCGRLTHRISLPYSIIGHGHVERAVKDTYCNSLCGECTHETTETLQECTPKTSAQPDNGVAPGAEETGHECHHHGRQHHGDGHRDHGDSQCTHTRGSGRGHGHHHGHGGQGQHEGRVHMGDIPQRPDHLDLGQAQQALNLHHLPLHDAAATRP